MRSYPLWLVSILGWMIGRGKVQGFWNHFRINTRKLEIAFKHHHASSTTLTTSPPTASSSSSSSSATPLFMTKQSEEDIRSSIRISREISQKQAEYMNESTLLSQQQYLDFDQELAKSLKGKRSYPSILLERMMQSLDDFQLSQSIKKLTKADTTLVVAEKMSNITRPRIVVLGTGWGSHSFLKSVDTTKYEVVVISPRNYFAFTPMLAASAVGTVEFRSICEPIRNVNPLADYLEATAQSIDFENKSVSCVSIKCEGTSCDMTDFEITYDYLVISVGAAVNTYGIKGVRDNCQFLKQVEDAANLRKAIGNCFERANIPNLTEEEIRNALSFVIVGAGPTGVEFTGELRDWIETEGRKYYGKLLKYVKITLVEAGNAVLPIFDEALQEEALKRLTERKTTLIDDGYIAREITQVLLKSGVKEVGEKVIKFTTGQQLIYGICVWAAGNGPLPLVLDCIEKVEEQKRLQSQAKGRIVVDDWLRVKGLTGVYAIGDCSYIEDNSLPATAQVASQQGSYLGRLFSKGFDMMADLTIPPVKRDEVLLGIGKDAKEDEKRQYLSERMKVGRLGVVVSDIPSSEKKVAVQYAKPFQFLNLGVLAYIGASEALAQIRVDSATIRSSGSIGFLLWRGIYWFKQVSWRNRALVYLDWIKARLFGRDLGAI